MPSGPVTIAEAGVALELYPGGILEITYPSGLLSPGLQKGGGHRGILCQHVFQYEFISFATNVIFQTAHIQTQHTKQIKEMPLRMGRDRGPGLPLTLSPVPCSGIFAQNPRVLV